MVLYGPTNLFYKNRALQRGARTVQTLPYKLKFNTNIGRYPAVPFMVVCFKERNLQKNVWNCVKPYDGSFSNNRRNSDMKD